MPIKQWFTRRTEVDAQRNTEAASLAAMHRTIAHVAAAGELSESQIRESMRHDALVVHENVARDPAEVIQQAVAWAFIEQVRVDNGESVFGVTSAVRRRRGYCEIAGHYTVYPAGTESPRTL